MSDGLISAQVSVINWFESNAKLDVELSNYSGGGIGRRYGSYTIEIKGEP